MTDATVAMESTTTELAAQPATQPAQAQQVTSATQQATMQPAQAKPPMQRVVSQSSQPAQQQKAKGAQPMQLTQPIQPTTPRAPIRVMSSVGRVTATATHASESIAAVLGTTADALTATPLEVTNDSFDIRPEYVERMNKTIEDKLQGRTLIIPLLFEIIATCMAVASKMKMSNSSRKKLVTFSVKKYIVDSVAEPERKQAMLNYVNATSDGAIDTLANVAKGMIKVRVKGCC